MDKKVRVRFAPSPTGPLHIGGLRTALFNYLFAKKHNGDFLLRIEDTDQNRFVPGAEDYIVEALSWCGISHDEGIGVGGVHAPYRQSQRKEIYKKYAFELVEKGYAYYAFDSWQELEKSRSTAEKTGSTFIYNWSTRMSMENSLSLKKEVVEERLQRGDDYVIRFNMPREIIYMTDIIRGEVTIDTSTLDDKVLFKSDGMPTYHLANIVDDHLMEITHVIRGEEWLPSMALHLMLYRAFSWQAPQFAHLPLILKPEGNGKLSKRDGDKMGFPVFPLLWTDPETGNISRGYREDGYLPQALINFLALLGWNAGDNQEIYSLDELINLFDLEKVHKAGARFDINKIKWLNHHYLQQMDDSVLADQFTQQLKQHSISVSKDKAQRVVSLVKERATFASDLWGLSSFFFIDPATYEPKAYKKQWKEKSACIVGDLIELFSGVDNFSSALTESVVKAYIEEHSLSMGEVMPLLRLALVGEMKGPHIFDIAEFIGKEKTIFRLKNLLNYN